MATTSAPRSTASSGRNSRNGRRSAMEMTPVQKVYACDAMAAHVTILDQQNTELRARVQALLDELDLYGVVYEYSGAVEALRSVFEGDAAT
jgi:hypothetical protein